MPMYSDRTNAENKISISDENKSSIVTGMENSVNEIAKNIYEKHIFNKRAVVIVIDTWYGTPINEFIAQLINVLTEMSLVTDTYSMAKIFLSPEQIHEYKKRFITDDSSFGYANSTGQINDILDDRKLKYLNDSVTQTSADVFIVYGTGAFNSLPLCIFDLKCYIDITREPMLWKMWNGELIPFGSDIPNNEYNWREFYYCDFYILNNQKKLALREMDFYIEGIECKTIKLIPRAAYDEIMSELVKYPIKQVKEFQPGPWGAFRYRDLFNVPGLGCNAWNRLVSPESSILIDVGTQNMPEVPLTSLMQYGRQLCGDYLSDMYPDLFPLEIWLDDGYFPDQQPAERISMPIHNHPGSAYVKEHFNEPLGRYETYYIAEAYKGANTWMGFSDDADLELWEENCRKSENMTVIPNWKEFIANHSSNEGDLYLIPPGTTHGHGGNQMVLEMDTSPSIAGTEYSFFEYDFARNTWNDKNKTMTGKPMKMHLNHAFDNEKWRREPYVQKHLRATRKVVEWNHDFSRDEYSTLPEMPFTVGRVNFTKRAEGSTSGGYLKLLTLTVGTSVEIISMSDSRYRAVLNRFQSAIIPACFGNYEIVNCNEGYTTVVECNWKPVQEKS